MFELTKAQNISLSQEETNKYFGVGNVSNQAIIQTNKQAI